MRIAGIRSISLDGAQVSEPAARDQAQGVVGSPGPSIPTAPGTIRVTASVSVVFELQRA
jgi:hypothetical protein